MIQGTKWEDCRVMCEMHGEGEHPSRCFPAHPGAWSVGLLLEGDVYLTLLGHLPERLWSFHSYTIWSSGAKHFLLRVSELEEIPGNILGPHHTDEETKLSKFK